MRKRIIEKDTALVDTGSDLEKSCVPCVSPYAAWGVEIQVLKDGDEDF